MRDPLWAMDTPKKQEDPTMTEPNALEKVVSAILADLTDRRGIRQAFDNIDDDVRAEIKESIGKHVSAFQQAQGAGVGEGWMPRIGDKVTVRQHDDMPAWASDWKGEYFVAGLVQNYGDIDNGVNVWLSDTWPPKQGDAADGFRLDEIAPAVLPAPSGPTLGSEKNK